MKKSELIELVKTNLPNANSINNLIVEKLNLKSGGGSIKMIKEIIVEFNLDTSHFDKNKLRRVSPKTEYKCKVCENKFLVSDLSSKTKIYCSRSCSNKDRILSDETKEKIRTAAIKNNKIVGLIDKYGENTLGVVKEMSSSGSTYDEILKIIDISKDDLKMFCKINTLNFNKVDYDTLNKENIVKLYLEHKTLKKVGHILGVSRQTIRKFVEDNEILKRGSGITRSKSVVNWRKDKKIKLVEYKGGCCQKCGYNKSI
jgi:DNA-binding CsgD family transcriptional regulator